MKKLILLLFLTLFIAFAVFFFSFSSDSEDDGCLVVFNAVEGDPSFDDIKFFEEDDSARCSRENTLILKTPDGSDSLLKAEPIVRKMKNIKFFAAPLIPERKNDDPAVAAVSEQQTKEDHDSADNAAVLYTPDKSVDFAVYSLYNDPLCLPEDFDDAVLKVQNTEINLILSGKYDVPAGKIVRPELRVIDSAKRPEMTVIVFSVIRSSKGWKKVVIRTFNRRVL